MLPKALFPTTTRINEDCIGMGGCRSIATFRPRNVCQQILMVGPKSKLSIGCLSSSFPKHALWNCKRCLYLGGQTETRVSNGTKALDASSDDDGAVEQLLQALQVLQTVPLICSLLREFIIFSAPFINVLASFGMELEVMMQQEGHSHDSWVADVYTEIGGLLIHIATPR